MLCNCGGSTIERKHKHSINYVTFELQYQHCTSCGREGAFAFDAGDKYMFGDEAIEAFDSLYKLTPDRSHKIKYCAKGMTDEEIKKVINRKGAA